MQTDRWQKIEEIFNRAVSLPAAEREKFVAENCDGDNELRREVFELLEADTAEKNPLDEDVLTLAFQCLEHDELLPAGTRLAAYRIEKLLGRGGMGAVYLARDSRLERDVALKILPSHFAENRQNVERFRQEARAASAVSHPNVAHIYEFGEAQDRYFLAMEYVQGKTLRELLKEKSVDAGRALEIARQIAAALDVMHRRGIIHRDIKPENIIITETNLVKILDFGLAKLTASAPENSVASLETAPGMIVGTTAYMSPEQIRGQRLDHRTDLWSLGVLMFEMLAGERPFTGETASDTQAAILLKDAPLVKIPTKAAPLVGRLLKKDAGERCQSIEEILPELERLKNEFTGGRKTAGKTAPSAFSEKDEDGQPFAKTGNFLLPLAVVLAAAFGIYFSGAVTGVQTPFAAPETPAEIPKRQIESLAVLPFEVDGGDERIDLLKEGLAEDLTRNLGGLRSLTVIAYQSARRARATDDLAEIKKRLNAKTVLRGRIAGGGQNEIKVVVELIETGGGAVLWKSDLSGAADELLKLRNALNGAILNEIQKFNGDSRLVLTDYGTRSNEAYRAYLEGKFAVDRRTVEGTRKAVKILERAVVLDPQYALAYTALAEAYNLLGTWYGEKPDFYQPLAEKTLEKALAVDSNLSEARTLLAKIKMDFRRDWAATEREFLRAIELNPSNAQAHHWYGEVFLSAMGRFDESLRELETARRLNPLSSGIVTGLAWTYIGKKNYQKAIELCDEALFINPSDDSAFAFKSMALMKLGRFDEAIETMKKASSGEVSKELGVYYALAGRVSEARGVLRKMRADPDVSPYGFAVVHAALGERDRAFELLEKQLLTNSVDLLSIRLDPLLDPLRDDPRFAEIERRLNLP